MALEHHAPLRPSDNGWIIDAMNESQAKGTNFLGMLAVFEKRTNKASADKLVASLPSEVGNAIRFQQIVPMGWYPVRWYRSLHDGIMKMSDGNGVVVIRELARETTVQDFTGLHRAILRVLSTKTVTGHAHRLMQLYWRGGTASNSDLRPGRSVIRFSGWVGFNPLVWADIAGSAQGIVEAAGGKRVQARVTSMSTDEADADVEVRWDD